MVMNKNVVINNIKSPQMNYRCMFLANKRLMKIIKMLENEPSAFSNFARKLSKGRRSELTKQLIKHYEKVQNMK